MRILTITGNIGQDAVIKAIPSGTEVCEFSVATTNRKDEETVWVKCALWGKRGVAMSPYLTKGSSVTVIGESNSRLHEGKIYHDVKVETIAFGGSSQSTGSKPVSQAPQAVAAPAAFDDFDDTIPF